MSDGEVAGARSLPIVQAPLSGERQRFAGKQVDPEKYLQEDQGCIGAGFEQVS